MLPRGETEGEAGRRGDDEKVKIKIRKDKMTTKPLLPTPQIPGNLKNLKNLKKRKLKWVKKINK